MQDYYERIHLMLERMKAQRAEDLFYPDFLTSNLVLDPQEQRYLENTLWGISPTRLFVSGVGASEARRGMPDFRNFSIGDIKSGEEATEGIVLQSGVPSAVDVIRRRFTRLFQSTVNTLYDRLNVGEMVFLVDYGRDELLGQFAVRDAEGAIEDITRVGGWARDFEKAHSLAQRAILDHEARYRFPIRPKMVLRQLPQGELVRSIDFHRDGEGNVDYKTPIERLMKRKRDLEKRMFAAALDAANWIDENGEMTRVKDIKTLTLGRQVIEDLDQTMAKLEELREKQKGGGP